MFKAQQLRLRFKPANGNQVIVSAQVSLYEPRGDYQLVVEHLEEAGDGALRLAFERLKTKLLQEGLFAAERKRELPLIPNHRRYHFAERRSGSRYFDGVETPLSGDSSVDLSGSGTG